MATIPATFPVILGGASAYAIGDTAGNIINDAATECGLAPVSDPYLSTDANFVRLCGLLKSVGRDLQRKRQWTHLQREYTFTTVADTANYDLPPDFRGMIAQTGWNRTNRLPLGGPLSPQEWQYLKGRLEGVAFRVLFRPVQQQMYLYPDTSVPVGDTIAFEYMSNYWVQRVGEPGPSHDSPSASLDIVLFESILVMRALKVAFLKSTGFDVTAALADLDDTWAMVASDDAPGPVLSINKSSLTEQMLGEQSIPITGYGAA